MATNARKQESMAETLQYPRYRSHKVVSALKIMDTVEPTHPGGDTLLVFEDGRFPPLPVDDAWIATRVKTAKFNAAPGYYVVYDNGYTSWSPVEDFENGYAPIPDSTLCFGFGAALDFLKSGYAVARSGWNGKGMWLSYSPGHIGLPAQNFWSPVNRDFAMQNGGTANVLPCITMKTATGEILMGWLASQTDMLADDWQIAQLHPLDNSIQVGDKVTFQPGPDQASSGPHTVNAVEGDQIHVDGIGVALPRKYVTLASIVVLLLMASCCYSFVANGQTPAAPKPPRSVEVITAELKQHAAQMQAIGGTMAQLEEFQAYVREERTVNQLQQELQAATHAAPPPAPAPAPAAPAKK